VGGIAKKLQERAFTGSCLAGDEQGVVRMSHQVERTIEIVIQLYGWVSEHGLWMEAFLFIAGLTV
jgi:hypothetical protein